MSGSATPVRGIDPELSANLYGGGCLDRLITEAVAPFRSELRRLDPRARLWAIRYNRRGEHLKLRIHTAADPTTVEGLLRQVADRAFRRLAPTPAERLPPPRFDVPAIDPEDEGAEPAADRSVLRTTYRRGRTTLGSRAIQADESLVDAIHRALAGGFERLLDAPRADAEKRLNRLLGTLIVGLTAAMPHPAARAAHLEYHRDWLFRFFVRERDREEALRTSFERRLAGMEPEIVVIRSAVAAPFVEPRDVDPWTLAMAVLAERLAGLTDDPALDPFATAPGQPVFFKGLHGVANVHGVPPLDEAFLCHLLLRALGPRPDERGGESVGAPALAGAASGARVASRATANGARTGGGGR
jgi:hypothetical protein